MKILLVQDKGVKIDLERSSNILNDLCNTVRFESYKSPINVELPSPYSIIRKTSPDLNDIYFLGIHEIARILNCSCERVDEIEFVGSILDKIYNSIANSRIIIAEVSSPNPNVYYELGYAHALNKPVILIANDMSSVPFDLRGYNHIIYKNIVDLRKKLKRRLEVLLEETT